MTTLTRYRPADFEGLSRVWRGLSREGSLDSPFTTHAWLLNWLRAFGDASHDVLVVRDAEGAAAAGAVLRREGDSLLPLEDHTYFGSARWRERDGLATFLAALSREGVRQLELQGLRSPTARADFDAASSGHFVIVEREPWVMRQVALPSFEGYLAMRDAKFRAELRRKRRRIEAIGVDAELTCFQGATVAEGYGVVEAVERESWKFEAGSSMANSERELSFYRGVLDLPTEAGEPRVYVMRAGAEPVAYLLGLRFARTFYALKTSYREAYASFSPGGVLIGRMLESLAAAGDVDSVELLGRDSRWKREVATSSREHCVYQLLATGASARLKSFAYERLRPLFGRWNAQKTAVDAASPLGGPPARDGQPR